MYINRYKPWTVFQILGLIFLIIGIIITLKHVVNVTPGLTIKHAARVTGNWSLTNLLILWAHVTSAVPPLALGLITFSTRVRVSYPKVHRWVGTIYCGCIWWSSILGMLLASANGRGIIAKLGFGLLGFSWFYTTTQAYIYARKRDFVRHRQWMIRSFSLTLAVVTVRPMFWWPPSFIPFNEWYLIVTWLCWVPNLIIGDLYARHTTISGKLKK